MRGGSLSFLTIFTFAEKEGGQHLKKKKKKKKKKRKREQHRVLSTSTCDDIGKKSYFPSYQVQ
jgi:hypothetical protein